VRSGLHRVSHGIRIDLIARFIQGNMRPDDSIQSLHPVPVGGRGGGGGRGIWLMLGSAFLKRRCTAPTREIVFDGHFNIPNIGAVLSERLSLPPARAGDRRARGADAGVCCGYDALDTKRFQTTRW
jgi:hypothetical protein